MPRRRRSKRPLPDAQPPSGPQIQPRPGLLPTLAVEIIEHIVSFLDHPRDLLSLALTSKRTLHIIIPIHLQTRLIRCDIRRTFLWKSLVSSHPIIAARFTALRIVDESLTIRPRSLTSMSDAILPVFLFDSSKRYTSEADVTIAMEQLVEVVSLMCSLESFHLESRTAVTSGLIKALRDSCPKISDLRLHSNDFWDYDEELHYSLWNFSSLSCFSLSSRTPLAIDHYQRIVNMLMENCLPLEYLSLSQGHDIAQELFRHGRWPNLRTLYITSRSQQPFYHMAIVQFFLDAHFKLEIVDIADLVGTFPIAYGPLRNLTIAKPYEKIYPRVPEMTMHLEQLSLHRANSIDTRAFFSSLHSLRVLIIHSTPQLGVVGYIQQYLPQLEKLHMKWPFHRQLSSADIESKHGVFQDACDFLRAMKRLTHLSGFTDELVGLYAYQADAIFRRFAVACPTLVFVQIRSRSARSRWVTIKREPCDGSYLGWDSIKPARGTKMEDWSKQMEPYPNWDRRISISKHSAPEQQSSSSTHPSDIVPKPVLYRPSPLVVLTLACFGIIAMDLTLLWVRESRLP